MVLFTDIYLIFFKFLNKAFILLKYILFIVLVSGIQHSDSIFL